MSKKSAMMQSHLEKVATVQGYLNKGAPMQGYLMKKGELKQRVEEVGAMNIETFANPFQTYALSEGELKDRAVRSLSALIFSKCGVPVPEGQMYYFVTTNEHESFLATGGKITRLSEDPLVCYLCDVINFLIGKEGNVGVDAASIKSWVK